MTRNYAHEDGIRIGGPRDPVAQSIRREQQADAAPSAAEANESHRRRLAAKGCLVCGEDDPDRLQMVQVPPAICTNGQQPPQRLDHTVLCDEHERPAKVLKRARMVQNARNSDADVLAVYGCGATLTASWDVPDDGELKRRNPRLDVDDLDDLGLLTKVNIATPPSVRAIHVGRGCGAELTEVITDI
jgi:hypothetical protein